PLAPPPASSNLLAASASTPVGFHLKSPSVGTYKAATAAAVSFNALLSGRVAETDRKIATLSFARSKATFGLEDFSSSKPFGTEYFTPPTVAFTLCPGSLGDSSWAKAEFANMNNARRGIAMAGSALVMLKIYGI